MLALCLMLLVTYYAFNYAGIIGLGLHLLCRPQPIMLKILPIMLLSSTSAQKIAYYAQYYARKY